MISNFFTKIVLYILKTSLRLWFQITKKDPDGHITETILELIEQDTENMIDADERALLGNVLDLKNTPVDNIMIARAKIVLLPDTSKADEILNLMLEKKMSQLIIYKDEIDNILGYISLEDVVACHKDKSCEFNIKNFLRPIDFISPSMNTLDLLLTLREKGQKMAIVVDEYGGVDGLVTFTDLIEEIIGTIQEGQEINPPGKIFIKSDNIIVDGHTRLAELNQKLGTHFENNEDISTIAGLICDTAGRLPARGEVIPYKNEIDFLILDATPRKIQRVSIRNLKLPPSAQG